MKAIEWSQQCYIIHHFLRCSRAANSLIGDGILTKFKLIQAFLVVLLICKNEYDLFKFESRSGHNISPFISLWGFFQTLKGSSPQSPRSDLAKFRIKFRFSGWPFYLQEWRRFNQKWRRLSGRNNIHQFLRCSRAANSIIGDGTLT